MAISAACRTTIWAPSPGSGRTLSPPSATPLTDKQGGAKPPADRLYGRTRSHPLRPRQQLLLDAALPRIRFPEAQAADPAGAFDPRPERLAIEIGFGSGEHAQAVAGADAGLGLIACEVFENGICSLLSRLVPEGAEAMAPLR